MTLRGQFEGLSLLRALGQRAGLRVDGGPRFAGMVSAARDAAPFVAAVPELHDPVTLQVRPIDLLLASERVQASGSPARFVRRLQALGAVLSWSGFFQRPDGGALRIDPAHGWVSLDRKRTRSEALGLGVALLSAEQTLRWGEPPRFVPIDRLAAYPGLSALIPLNRRMPYPDFLLVDFTAHRIVAVEAKGVGGPFSDLVRTVAKGTKQVASLPILWPRHRRIVIAAHLTAPDLAGFAVQVDSPWFLSEPYLSRRSAGPWFSSLSEFWSAHLDAAFARAHVDYLLEFADGMGNRPRARRRRFGRAGWSRSDERRLGDERFVGTVFEVEVGDGLIEVFKGVPAAVGSGELPGAPRRDFGSDRTPLGYRDPLDDESRTQIASLSADGCLLWLRRVGSWLP